MEFFLKSCFNGSAIKDKPVWENGEMTVLRCQGFHDGLLSGVFGKEERADSNSTDIRKIN